MKTLSATIAMALTTAMALITALLYTPQVSAEYRAYELLITNTEKSTTRTVQSVLDHLQYPTYYPLNKDEIIEYVDSWMCYENMSNFRRICAKPEREAASAAQMPNSTTPLLKPNSLAK